MESFIISPIAILILHVVFLLAFVIFLIILLNKVFNPKNARSTTNYQARLIALGITATIFRQTLFSVALRPFTMFIDNITYLLNYITYNAKLQNNNQTRVDLDINFLGRAFGNFFQDFPFGKLLLAIGAGILIYRFIVYCFTQADNSTSAPSNSAPGQNAFIYNLLIVFVLAFSLFLVLSVFISIPYLNEIKKPSLFTKSSLDSALNSIRLSDTSFVKKDLGNSPFPSNFIKDSVLKDPQIRKHYDSLSGKIRKEIDEMMSSIDDECKFFDGRRKEAITKINNSVDQYAREKPANMQKVMLNYERYIQSNAVDKDLLFTTSVNVYRNYIRGFRNDLNQTYVLFSESDINNATEYSRLINRLNKTINSFFNVNDSVTLNVYQTSSIPYFQSQFSIYNSDILASSLDFDVTVSVSKRDGSDWGFFGLIARFLIKTESLDLVLLIGMLGFGLLGASVSSFQIVSTVIPSTDSPQSASFFDAFKSKPIIKDFWNVLARGFSAAILIYLATKGGIAILTSNVSADPNGYILLFMCFIGAVFSEKVWNAAKTKYGL